MVTSALRSVGRWGRAERCGKDLGGLATARLAAQEEGPGPRGHLNHQACRQVPLERAQAAKANSREAGWGGSPRRSPRVPAPGGDAEAAARREGAWLLACCWPGQGWASHA